MNSQDKGAELTSSAAMVAVDAQALIQKLGGVEAAKTHAYEMASRTRNAAFLEVFNYLDRLSKKGT